MARLGAACFRQSAASYTDERERRGSQWWSSETHNFDGDNEADGEDEGEAEGEGEGEDCGEQLCEIIERLPVVCGSRAEKKECQLDRHVHLRGTNVVACNLFHR